MNKWLISILGVGTVFSSFSPALAIPFGTNTVYKATVNGQTVVYLSGTSGSTIDANLGITNKSSTRTAGACGEVKINSGSGQTFSTITVDSLAIDVSTLPTQTLPACRNGSFAEPRTANFKTATGSVVVVGKTPNSAVVVSVPQSLTKKLRVNNCGFATLRGSTTTPLPSSFSVGSSSYEVSTLPDSGNPPLCRTSNGISRGYVPITWTTP